MNSPFPASAYCYSNYWTLVTMEFPVGMISGPVVKRQCLRAADSQHQQQEEGKHGGRDGEERVPWHI